MVCKLWRMCELRLSFLPGGSEAMRFDTAERCGGIPTHARKTAPKWSTRRVGCPERWIVGGLPRI